MRLILLIVLFSLSFSLEAQDKILSQHIGWRGSDIELHTITNRLQSCTYVLSKDSVKSFLMTGNSEIAEAFTVRRRPDENFLGSFIKNGSIYLFMDNGDMPGLHSWSFNINTKTLTEHVFPFEIKESIIINRLSSDNHFFYFTVNKKKPDLVVYKFNNESSYDTLRYTIDKKTWESIINKKFLKGPELKVGKADMEGECDIDIAQNPNKVYVRNDTLLFLMDGEKDITSVYSFDLINNKINYRFISHDHNDESTPNTVFNSFLLRDKLYYAWASPNNLFIQITDFNSGKSVKEFSASWDRDIPFKNTIITQEGGTFGSKEITKTNQLLRKMTNGNIVITATPDDLNNQVTILVGSYKVRSSGGGGMWMPVGGGFGAPGVTLSVGFFPTGGFSRQSWTVSAHFKMLINAETDEHVIGEVPKSITEKIEEYTSDIKIPEEGENLFVLNHRYLYAFYDKKERTFVVTKF